MPGAERDKLMDTYEGMQAKLQQEITKIVNQKPNSVVTAFILSVTYGFNEDVVVLENRFNQLGGSVKKSETGVQLAQFIAKSKSWSYWYRGIGFFSAGYLR